MNATRTRRIAAAFSAAAPAYDSAATVQATVAARLAARVAGLPALERARHVVEVGCGTGLLTRALLPRLPAGARLLATDLSPAMVERARGALTHPALSFAVMDADRPALPPGGADLVVSSFAAQWFADLPAALAGLADALAPGGILALTLPGAGTFAEWRAAHRAAGVESGLADFPTPDRLAAMAPTGGVAWVGRETVTSEHPDALAFARALAATGAVVPRPGHRPLPSGRMRRIIAALGAPCRMSWDILTLTFTKDPTER